MKIDETKTKVQNRLEKILDEFLKSGKHFRIEVEGSHSKIFSIKYFIINCNKITGGVDGQKR